MLLFWRIFDMKKKKTKNFTVEYTKIARDNFISELEKLKRATFMPACMILRIMSSSSVAGPIVQTIFVFLIIQRILYIIFLPMQKVNKKYTPYHLNNNIFLLRIHVYSCKFSIIFLMSFIRGHFLFV